MTLRTALTLFLVAAPSWAQAPALCHPLETDPAALPPPARWVVEEYQHDKQRIEERLQLELQSYRSRAVLELGRLLDQYTRAGQLDEALAVRQALRDLQGIKRHVGPLSVFEGDVGKVLLLETVGTTQGSVWDTGAYTADSELGAVAVHAGVLRPGETGTVRVFIERGLPSYVGTTRNGVTH